jgi:NADH:ubiquinone oxidoreductase subunit H
LLTILSVAFVTLFERHLLRFRQGRIGPNKVFFFGLVQPLLDGVKLIKKEQFIVSKASDLFFLISPSGVFFVFFLEFFCVPFFFFFFNFQFSFLFLLCLVGASVYFVVVSSVVRKSKYSFLGGIRSSRQSVSFEIVFSIYLFCFILSLGGFELKSGFFFVNFFLFFFFFFFGFCRI